jgi:Methyltransferase domain
MRQLTRRKLISRLPKHGVGAEVGAWKGNFSAQILKQSKSRLLYLIDPWAHRDDPGYERAWYGGRVTGQADLDAIYQSVLERFEKQMRREQVVILRKSSVEAAEILADRPLDWVYIDGDHTYEGVKADLEAFRRVVSPGGVLAGDDYGIEGWWSNGVTKAVDELAASVGQPEIFGNQFLFQL